MIHVCKNPRGAGGFHFVAHGLYDVRISDDLIWEDRQKKKLKEIMKQAYDEGKKPRWGSI